MFQSRFFSVIFLMSLYPLSVLSQKSEIQKNLDKQLYESILKNSAIQIKESIKAGANINAIHNGLPMFFLALIIKKNEAIKALLEYNPKIDEKCIQALIKGTYPPDFPFIIELIQKSSMNIDTLFKTLDGEKTLLNWAIYYGDYESAIKLIELGASLNNFQIGNHPDIDTAIKLFTTLLKKNYPINNFLLFHWWAYDQSGRLIEFLLKNGANSNHENIISKADNGYFMQTPMVVAMQNDNYMAIKTLLTYKADINKKFTENINELITPLYYMINHAPEYLKNKAEIIELLLSYGATY